MSLKVVIILICFTIFKRFNCGEFYRENGRNYYVSYPEKRNWHQALRYCAYNGLYLVDIHTNVENNRIRSVINQTETKYKISTQNYWTVGTDLGSEGTFYWATSGHSFMFLDWAIYQPDNGGNVEDCVHFWADKEGKWNDFACSEKMYFMCRDTFDVPSYANRGCSINMDGF